MGGVATNGVVSVFDAATNGGLVLNEDGLEAQERSELARELIEEHPELSADTLTKVAADYEDINASLYLGPVLGAASGAAAYTYHEEFVDEDDDFFWKAIMVGFMAGVFEMFASPLLSQAPKRDTLESDMRSKYGLNPNDAEKVAKTLRSALDDRFNGYIFAPALVSVLGAKKVDEFVENHTPANEL